MAGLKRLIGRLLGDRSAGAVIEYCLIAGLIVLGLVGVVTQIGQTTNANYVAVETAFE
jgi:Flp pilus assembly pilin Flp